MKLYEGMFIIDNALANSDWNTVVGEVQNILKNRGADILNSEKWDERKFAYELKGHKRGTYLLIYFKVPPDSITSIKREFKLSDKVLRTLIVKVDKIKEPTSRETEKTEEKTEGKSAELVSE